MPPQPGERALDHPASGQDTKPAHARRWLRAGCHPDISEPSVGMLDNLHPPAQRGGDPVGKRALVPAVHPDQLEPRQPTAQRRQQRAGADPIRLVGGMDVCFAQQALRIDQQMALAPAHVLAAVVAARPPFSVVFVDWLSRIAALGVGSRPS